MSDFIPRAMFSEVEFTTDKNVSVSIGGLTNATNTGVRFWKGLITLPPDVSTTEALSNIAKHDNSSDVFFAELLTEKDLKQINPSDAIPEPVWTDAKFSLTSVVFSNNYTEVSLPNITNPLDLAKNSIISIRHLGQLDYVTARVIVDKIERNNVWYYKLNHPVPTELFYSGFENNLSQDVEACINRPHCTAFFTDTAVRYNLNPEYKQIAPLAWTEATGQMIYALRERVPVSANNVETEGGDDYLFEDGLNWITE